MEPHSSHGHGQEHSHASTSMGRKQGTGKLLGEALELLFGPHGVCSVRPNTAEAGSRAVPTDTTALGQPGQSQPPGPKW